VSYFEMGSEGSLLDESGIFKAAYKGRRELTPKTTVGPQGK